MKTRKSHDHALPHVLPSVWAGKSPGSKRGLRILPRSGGYFSHVTSRTVHRRFLFGEAEKGEFVDLMRRWADFSGITVLTHCVMSNHFHLFLWVPEAQQVPIEEIERRIRRVWPERKVEGWLRYYRAGDGRRQREMRRALTERMHDLPAFMRVLKQSFSVWYNERHEVCGTLWEGRYRCMVVQDATEALMSVGAYIDLNPVRAGLCGDPGEYRWSGYGQASGGDGEFRRGVRELVGRAGGRLPREAEGMRGDGGVVEGEGWDRVERIYRAWLYAKGRSERENPGVSERRRRRRGFAWREVLAEFERAVES